MSFVYTCWGIIYLSELYHVYIVIAEQKRRKEAIKNEAERDIKLAKEELEYHDHIYEEDKDLKHNPLFENFSKTERLKRSSSDATELRQGKEAVDLEFHGSGKGGKEVGNRGSAGVLKRHNTTPINTTPGAFLFRKEVR